MRAMKHGKKTVCRSQNLEDSFIWSKILHCKWHTSKIRKYFEELGTLPSFLKKPINHSGWRTKQKNALKMSQYQVLKNYKEKNPENLR